MRFNLDKFKCALPLHLMMLPAVVLTIIYRYIPMAGILIAFQKFTPARGLFGSPWVGLKNFEFLFMLPNIWQVIYNTLYISILKIIIGLIIPIIVAILLNEVRKQWFLRTAQTLVFLPYFISWVLLAGIFRDILSPDGGIVNSILGVFGVDPIYFLGDNKWFRFVLILTDTWKNYGFNTVVYLAALTGISIDLYEAAEMDGANRWQQTLHITLPGMMPMILLLTTLSVGGVLNAGFDQVFNLYGPAVYQTGDIIDTLTYRIGIVKADYSLSTAISVIKSAVSFILLTSSYLIAHKYADYRIF